MKIRQQIFENDQWNILSDDGVTSPQLVLYFASPELCRNSTPFRSLHTLFPDATIAGLSTGGEIMADEVFDHTLAATAIELEHSQIRHAQLQLTPDLTSAEAGQQLAAQLPAVGLRLVWLLSDGLMVNGSELIRGCREEIPQNVMITGGLAGDGPDFNTTFTGCNREPEPGQIVAIGFYGDRLQVNSSSFGGWDRFGPLRTITRSEGNVLYELDGQPALNLYKHYLGDEAENLPGSGLLFPLSIRAPGQDEGAVVRTILAVDENENSLTFAGNLPEGYSAQLMRGNFDRLIEGAAHAAEHLQHQSGRGLALLVSCIGRKLLMGQRINDEVEVVADILGSDIALTGFYSYGEIAPDGSTGLCELHNQTMTITLLQEE
ncbi:MAG: FIST C-terminal domain-containing protein [Oceanospirillum sp.]|nr:FIST C-terminal domain-containing protein [Oceanospirillum sp.]